MKQLEELKENSGAAAGEVADLTATVLALQKENAAL